MMPGRKDDHSLTSSPRLPGLAPWYDSVGRRIQAHSGSMLVHGGRYYWYGEDKAGPTRFDASLIVEYRVDVIGIRCYSSPDLVHWVDEGLVLPAQDMPGHDLAPPGICERPKVLRDPRSGLFILWVHIDTPNYEAARAGWAVATSPTGPFRYQGSLRPNGSESRDLTLFLDHDGRGWLIHSSEGNQTLMFSELRPDLQGFTGTFHRHLAGQRREAPVLFRRHGLYHLITSGCTGWDPNAADCSVARSLAGPWTSQGNPCSGPGGAMTWGCQSSFAFQDAQGDWIVAFDRHSKTDLDDSRYLWVDARFSGERLRLRFPAPEPSP